VSEAVEEKWVVGVSLCVAAEVVPCMLALLGNSKGGAMILLDKNIVSILQSGKFSVSYIPPV